MHISYDLSGQNTPVNVSFKAYGSAADLVLGSLVEPGAATASLGSVVYASQTAPTVVCGVTTKLHDYSVVGDFTYTAITTNTSARVDVDIRPNAVFCAELAVCSTQAITIAASAGSTAAEVGLGTSAGAADELGGGFLYNAATDELRYIEDHDAAATATFANDIGTTAWAGINPYFVPPELFGAVASTGFGLNATRDQFVLEGNETGAWGRVLYTEMSADGVARHRVGLADDNQTLANAKFYVYFVIHKHCFKAQS